uniref:Uncharacterized protein isoform X3 n=1 Tax=Nicotiana tabacum TaxID=4097 RepID=A0A1S3YZH6_TOBAC|nr:PREDICTED: uncharacterized protein LOC107781523 isoform X3 [Nicotiana tabacum]
MGQEGSSRKNKKEKNPSYVQAGSLSCLAKKKRMSLTTKETVQAIRSEKEHLLKLIEEQPTIEERSEANERHVEEQFVEGHIVDEQMQIDSTTPTTNERSQEQASDPVTQKKKRGRTQMRSVHSRKTRKVITLNHLNQPVGPTKEDVREFGSFLGTLARTATLCPLDILDWRKMDTKDDLWTYTKLKYDIPDAAKKWTLFSIGNAWRRHKSQLKKDYYDGYPNDEVRKARRPDYIPEYQFKELLKYWSSDKLKRSSEINKENRKKQQDPHTAGKTSFALIRNELEKTKESVSLKEMFVATRARKPGRVYKDSDDNTTSKIAEMEKIETQQSAEGSQSVDAFSSVMGPEHPGRLRLYGRGVTKSTLKGKVGHFESTSNATNDTVQEMQEKIRKMEEQMEEQRRTMRQEITADVIAQLQRAGLINPNVVATLSVSSPGEAASAPQDANQLIRRQSEGSNNEGAGQPGGFELVSAA